MISLRQLWGRAFSLPPGFCPAWRGRLLSDPRRAEARRQAESPALRPRFVIMVLAAMLGSASAGPKPLPSYQLPIGKLPPAAEGVRVDENLGSQIDLRLTFRDEEGKVVALNDYFHQGRPVIVNLVYYNCPMLCNLVLNGQTQVMREIPWTPGNEYEIVTISIDPNESPELAKEKKAVHLASYGKPAPGWHFLTDYDNNAKKLSELIGFHYRYDQLSKQYAHPAAVMILSPQGKVSRYLYGVRYKARDVRFALAEASENRTTMAVEKMLLLCYQYDPKANSYVMFATNFMKMGGILTVLGLGFFLWKMFRGERKERKVIDGLAS